MAGIVLSPLRPCRPPRRWRARRRSLSRGLTRHTDTSNSSSGNVRLPSHPPVLSKLEARNPYSGYSLVNLDPPSCACWRSSQVYDVRSPISSSVEGEMTRCVLVAHLSAVGVYVSHLPRSRVCRMTRMMLGMSGFRISSVVVIIRVNRTDILISRSYPRKSRRRNCFTRRRRRGQGDGKGKEMIIRMYALSSVWYSWHVNGFTGLRTVRCRMKAR